MSQLPADPHPVECRRYPGSPWLEGTPGGGRFLPRLAPLLRPFRFRRDAPFVQHHAARALATIVAFLAVLFGGGIYLMVLSYLLVFRRDLYERLPPLGGWDAPVPDVLLFAPASLGWLLAWLGGLLLALSGSRNTLPLTGRLACRPLLLRLAFVGNASL